MTNELVICDTNIFISAFEGKAETVETMTNKIGLSNVVISSITYMELCRGAQNKQQLLLLSNNLKGYRILHYNEEASLLAMNLIKRYHLSHSLQIPDAIIAASSITFNIPLCTYNLKDFRYIENIKLYKA